jgi:hypothetical protein
MQVQRNVPAVFERYVDAAPRFTPPRMATGFEPRDQAVSGGGVERIVVNLDEIGSGHAICRSSKRRSDALVSCHEIDSG